MMRTKIDGLAVRRSIEINAPPSRVWEELASAERFRLWYSTESGVAMPCTHIEYEPREGGRFEVDIDFHGFKTKFTGKVLVFDPPNELTVDMNPAHIEQPPLLLTFALTALEGGRTKAEIIQHGFERLGDRAQAEYDSYEASWTMTQLELLRDLAEAS